MKAFPFLRGSALEGIFLPSTKYTYLGYGFASIVFLGNVVINSKPYNNVAIKIINPERNKTNEAFHEVMLSSFVNERLLGKVGGKHFAQTIAFGATNRKDFFSKIFGVGIVEEEGKLKTGIEETSDFDNSVPKSQRAVWSKILQNSTYKTIYVIIQENAGTQTLADYMETVRTPLDVHVIRSIAFQLMIAIHTASSSFGFVHSDIRWENIMIEPLPSNTNLQYALRQQHPNDKFEYFVIPDARVVVKLIDFGSSFLQKERTELIRSGTKPKGDMTDPYEWPHTLTFLFMPDEYGPTFSSDLFAIGIILLSLSCLNRNIGVLQDGFPQLQDTPRYEIRLNLLKRDFLQHRGDFKSLNSIPNVRWRETIPDKQLLQLLNTILEFVSFCF
jgi:serine/threonine protein kinase